MNNDLTFALELCSLKVRLKALRDDQILLYGPWNTEHIGREVLSQQSRGNGFSLSILPPSLIWSELPLFTFLWTNAAVTLYFSVHFKILDA